MLPEVCEAVVLMPSIRYSDFKYKASWWVREELMKGKRVITADGREVGVVMSVEDYFAMQAINPNPKRAPRFVRVVGVLYREVL